MRNTLGLDDDLDSVEMIKDLETAFGMRFSDVEAAACENVSDIFQIVRSRFTPPSHGAGLCATAMAFYRVRRALRDLGVQLPLDTGSRVEAVTGLRGRRLLKQLGRRSGLQQSPRPEAALLGQVGSLTIAAGLIWLLATAVVARHLWYISLIVSALGFVLLWIDPGQLPADCRTLGDLARRVAGLNFRHLHDQGAKARDQDLWGALVEVLLEYTSLPKAEIGPDTLLLDKQLSSV